MTVDFGELFKTLAPSLVSAVGTAVQADSYDNAADNFAASAQNAADTLKTGYDKQLENIEQGTDYIRGLYGAGLEDTSGIISGAAGQYGTDLGQAVYDFGDYMLPQVDQYGNVMMAADTQYRGDIINAQNQAISALEQGSGAFEQEYTPYKDAGNQALSYLLQVLGTSPDQLNPSQLRMMKDYMENAVAQVAASGMRGSGRGGIASILEGRAGLNADLYDINQRRQDQAASQLAGYGYNTAGQLAGNKQALANSVADLKYKTGNLAAANTSDTIQNIAGTRYGLAGNIGEKGYGVQTTGAKANLDAENTIAGNVGTYYGNLAGLEGGRFQSRADTEMGKAIADASAIGTIADNNQAQAIQAANQKNNLFGQVTKTLSDYAKQNITNQTQDQSKKSAN